MPLSDGYELQSSATTERSPFVLTGSPAAPCAAAHSCAAAASRTARTSVLPLELLLVELELPLEPLPEAILPSGSQRWNAHCCCRSVLICCLSFPWNPRFQSLNYQFPVLASCFRSMSRRWSATNPVASKTRACSCTAVDRKWVTNEIGDRCV